LLKQIFSIDYIFNVYVNYAKQLFSFAQWIVF
jgi:hypothetical protein